MLKLLTIGFLGVVASLVGLWLSQHLKQQAAAADAAAKVENVPLQLKTEMTGIPVVTDGSVSGYLVFQISSTIDTSKLASQEFNVAPYILDAAIRASYQSTEDGAQKFNANFIKKLSALVQVEANNKLNAEIVTAVNIEQFNFVPKEEIRGNMSTGGHKE